MRQYDLLLNQNLIYLFRFFSKQRANFDLFFSTVVDKSIDLVIPAHDAEVGAIAVNPDGTLIASASERGHIIKIYSTDAGEVVQELKRGNKAAIIENILFHPHKYILACTSSK